MAKRRARWWSPWGVGCLALVLMAGSGALWSTDEHNAIAASADDDALASFDIVYKVLQHPRCLNCHPDGQRPLQFDNRTPHTMNVVRGPEGRGVAAMQCVSCHGQANATFPHGPPGIAGEWRLAPLSMVFENESKRSLAERLLDPERSHMTPDELIEHVEHDALVLWGWDPGPGRKPVPTPHAEFVRAFKHWINAGAPLPPKEADDE